MTSAAKFAAIRRLGARLVSCAFRGCSHAMRPGDSHLVLSVGLTSGRSRRSRHCCSMECAERVRMFLNDSGHPDVRIYGPHPDPKQWQWPE